MHAYVLVIIVISALFKTSYQFEFKHHNNEEIVEIMEKTHAKCPNITRIYTLSETSVRGTPLYLIEFSTKPGHHEIMKPEFKYIANMHGDEVLGRELLLKLMDYLCEKYLEGEPNIQALIEQTRIHLMPTMNPDGWQLATETNALQGRENNHTVDLNRNFPNLDRIMFSNEENSINNNNHLLQQITSLQEPLEPETKAIIRLILQVPFVLSANMHGGDLVANYPYDESKYGQITGEYTKSPDDQTFRHLALSYSLHHADMSSPTRKSCDVSDGDKFQKNGGITNGAKWYSVEGGMQDFNYLSSNDFEITLELGCEKYPSATVLENEWERNKNALIHYIWQTHIGVKGIVYDALSKKGLGNTLIHVKNITSGFPVDIPHDITSVHGGDYFRLLTPGIYRITAYKEGYIPHSRMVTVYNRRYTQAQRLDFALRPVSFPPLIEPQFGNGIDEARSADSNENEWFEENEEPIAMQ